MYIMMPFMLKWMSLNIFILCRLSTEVYVIKTSPKTRT